MANYADIKKYVNMLGYDVSSKVAQTEIIVISNKKMGINNLVIDCEKPILIIEQIIFHLKEEQLQDSKLLLMLLKINRRLMHGAFAIDEDEQMVVYRDTLQLKNLDLNELKASIDSLSMAMTKYADEFSKFEE